MNEEEQEAIRYVKFTTITGLETLHLDKDVEAINTIMELLDRQQKEIDQLKETMKKQYVSKKIIRDKIDDLIGEQGTGNLAQYIAIGEKLQVLREILGE